jgi:hypothetical protein
MPARGCRCYSRCEGAPQRGNRIGNWLTREQAQELLSLPDRESLKGKRDYASSGFSKPLNRRKKKIHRAALNHDRENNDLRGRPRLFGALQY